MSMDEVFRFLVQQAFLRNKIARLNYLRNNKEIVDVHGELVATSLSRTMLCNPAPRVSFL
jgi:hypothetical protein